MSDDFINFPRQHESIQKRRSQYYPTRTKIHPLQQGNSLAKEKNQHLNAAITAYDGAEVSENVDLFLLNNLTNTFGKIVLVYIEPTDLPYSKISIIIVQIKYVKNSTNYSRKADYNFRLEHWYSQTISQT